MTENRRAKREARQRQQSTGEPYTAARRNTAVRPAGVVQQRLFEPDHCANCLAPLPEKVEALFCSELCSQTAETVRYWRRVSRDRRINHPAVKLALNTRVAHLLAGGYRRQARHLSQEVRQQIWTRDGGICTKCGKSGVEIDHVDGDSADPANRQLLCLDCHHAKTALQMTPAGHDQTTWIDELMAARVAPDTPALRCDDEVRWAEDWRSLKKERRARLFDQIRDRGYDPDGFAGMSLTDMWDAVADADAADTGGYTEDDDTGYGPYSYFAHAMAKDN